MASQTTHSREFTSDSPMLRSLHMLSQNSSRTRIQLLEANEYCRYANVNLKLQQTRLDSLESEKKELQKMRDELCTRNKINATNLESLFRAQSEFYDYKCDVKAGYIAIYENRKAKRLKYEKIINSYQIKWENAELEYNKIPMVMDLLQIQKENDELSEKIDQLDELLHKTQNGYLQLMKFSRNNLLSKILMFAKERQNYLKFDVMNQKILMINQKKRLTEELVNMDSYSKREESRRTELFKAAEIDLNETNTTKQNCNMYNTVDLAAFDKMALPMEKLEIQNDEILFPNKKANEMNPETDHSNTGIDNITHESYVLETYKELNINITDPCSNGKADKKDVLENYNKITDQNELQVHEPSQLRNFNESTMNETKLNQEGTNSLSISCQSAERHGGRTNDRIMLNQEKVEDVEIYYENNPKAAEATEVEGNAEVQSTLEATNFMNDKSSREEHEATTKFSFFLNNVDSNNVNGSKSIFNLF